MAGLGDDEAVTVSDTSAAAANLNTLNLETVGVINAATVLTLTVVCQMYRLHTLPIQLAQSVV